MDNDYAREILAKRNKSIQAVQAVEKCMRDYGIPQPTTSHISRIYNDLPKEPDRREAVVLWQLKYSNLHPQAIHEIGEKLNYLLVYADVGHTLNCDLIGLDITQKLKRIQNDIPPPSSERVSSQRKPSSRRVIAEHLNRMQPIESREPGVSYVVTDNVCDDINKYTQIGEVKKLLYSMPQYLRNRDSKGAKLPSNKVKAQTKQMNLNISKVRCADTKLGRKIVMEKEKQKKIEKLKQQLKSRK